MDYARLGAIKEQNVNVKRNKECYMKYIPPLSPSQVSFPPCSKPAHTMLSVITPPYDFIWLHLSLDTNGTLT